MIINARNKVVTINDTKMDYVSFGSGADVLVIIPGLSDGIRTVKGMAFALAFMYPQLAKHFRIYVFSRKREIPSNYSIEAMADDLIIALDALNIKSAHFLGISQGGMIVQWLTIKYPTRVNKLILAVTLARQNETIKAALTHWISLGQANDYKSLLIDTTEKTYSSKLLKKYRRLYKVVTKISHPKDFTRFIIQANACLDHDVYSKLSQITCPTLVIGGAQDAIVGIESSHELSQQIKGSTLFIYDQYGHGAYEEAKDFQQIIIKFLNN